MKRTNPRKKSFLTKRELEEARRDPFGPWVLAPTYVVCLECGGKFRSLGNHLLRTHRTAETDYKEVWGYNESQPLQAVGHGADPGLGKTNQHG